jgi:hypothetical protein
LYLEQRRELGEYDLVLDKLPVADVLALLGARDASPATKAHKSHAAPETKPRATEVRETPPEIAPAESVAPPPPPQPRFDERSASSDWRAALKASGVIRRAHIGHTGEQTAGEYTTRSRRGEQRVAEVRDAQRHGAAGVAHGARCTARHQRCRRGHIGISERTHVAQRDRRNGRALHRVCVARVGD